MENARYFGKELNMIYGEEVHRLRKTISGLKGKLGHKRTNDDLFQAPVGPHELEELKAEEDHLMRCGYHEEQKQADRTRALAEMKDLRGTRGVGTRDVRPKPRDNSDLFVPAEEFKRRGGN
jgi:hypothetical protein